MRLDHERVLVVAAHPDDEVLGCGGTCARLADGGAQVTALILSEGLTSRQAAPDREAWSQQLAGLGEDARRAAEILGLNRVIQDNLPDNRFDSVDLLDIVKRIEAVREEVSPTLVLTHHAGDLNIDHVLTQRAVLTAFRPLPGSAGVCLYAFEVLSSTEYSPPGLAAPFAPTTYVDIAEHMDRKLDAMRAYASEIREDPHPRSREAIRDLAAVRGRQCGVRLAEGFVTLREVF